MPTTPETATDYTAETAKLVNVIRDIWTTIRSHHPDVPPVAITLGSGKPKTARQAGRHGHFHAGMWAAEGQQEGAELFLAGESLERGPEGTLGTLLHEAAHGAAHTRGIKDTSRQGRWHNTKFKEIAEEHLLEVTKDDKIGWSPSALTDAARARYANELAALAEIGVVRTKKDWTGTSGSIANKKVSGWLAAECGCGRKIRMSRSVAEGPSIICGSCGDPFAADLLDQDGS